MNGFIVVDKPKGLTSTEVVERIRKITGEKAGHTGTLDRLATGVLIVALGKATKLSSFVSKQDKCYIVKGIFGLDSPSYDLDHPEVKKVECKSIEREELERAISSFKGKFLQKPPPYSAVRIKGARAYEYARKGLKVELKEREVEVYQISLLDFSFPEFTVSICCSSGTYVRSIVHDIGKILNCPAVVGELRRTKVGKVGQDRAIPLSEINEENFASFVLKPQEVLDFPIFELSEETFKKFTNGVKIPVKLNNGFYSAIFKGRFVGVGKVESGVLKPVKVLER